MEYKATGNPPSMRSSVDFLSSFEVRTSNCESPLEPHFCVYCWCCFRLVIAVLLSIMSSVGPPPPGGDYNRAGNVYAFTWTLAIASLIFVLGRMYSRMKLTRNVGWDDWCVCFALVRFSHNPSGIRVKTRADGSSFSTWLSL